MYIFLFFVTILGYFVKGLSGFGNTVIMAPLFAFKVNPAITSPIDLLFSVPTNFIITWKERKNIDFKVVLPLITLIFIGNIPGMLFLKYAKADALKIFLGLLVTAIGLYMLFSKNKTYKMNKWVLGSIGILSGVLTGMFGIALPIVIYITQSVNSKGAFRANLCFVFLMENIFRLLLYGVSGILSAYVIKLALILAPAVFIGLYLGILLESKLNEEISNKIIYFILISSGLLLAITNLLK